jgi:hypothetical protein
MGALKTKILTYSPEQYYPNDSAYVNTNLTNSGSGPTGTWTKTGGTPTLNATGGPDGSGCWQFTTDSTGETSLRVFGTTTSNQPYSSQLDADYSSGFWFRIPNVISGATESILDIGRVGGASTSASLTIALTGTNIGKITHAQPTTLISTTRYDDGAWHYYAERMSFDGTNYIRDRYIDGSLWNSGIVTNSGATSYIGMADNSITSSTGTLTYIEVAHFYVATSSSINGTAISQIWSAGTTPASTNITFNASPVTASASITESTISGNVNISTTAFIISPIGLEPTIVTTTSNSVNITTSIYVVAQMVNPLPGTSLTIVLSDTMNASALTVTPVFGISTPVYIYSTPITASTALQTNITNVADKQVSYAASPTTANATIVNPPTIISDDEVIIYSDIMSASAEIPLPDFGEVLPDPLYWRSGTLQSKIATYGIEHGTEFNYNGTNYQLIPSYGTNYTNGWSSYSPNSTGYTPIYDATDGPYASGTGCWKLSGSRQDKALATGITSDLNYTIGVWFKVPTLPTGTSANGMRIFTLGTATITSTSLDYSVHVTGSSHTTAPSQLAISLNGTTYDYIGSTLNTTDWYYLAVRRTGSTGVNNFEVYINGELKLVKTNSDTSTSYSRFHIGDNSTTSANGVLKYQNFHAATATTLTSYEIDQIWQAGTKFPPAATVNVSHASDRFLATALSISPTIVAIKGDHVEITTSVTVSSELIEPSWSTGEIVKINAGSLGTVQATFGDNVQIETNGDKSITPEALLATVKMVEPILSRQPAYAYASLPMPTIYISPNYFASVMNHDPVFYIEDGQKAPVNYGSWEATFYETEYVDTVQAGLEMDTIGNQKAWMANSNSVILSEPNLQANIPNYQTKVNDLYATRNVTIELWYTSIGKGSTTNHLRYVESGPIFNDGITQISEVWDWFGCAPGLKSDPPLNKIVLISERIVQYNFNDVNSFTTFRTYNSANPKLNEWNHLVVSYEAVADPTKIRRKVYLNTAIVGNELLTISNSSLNSADDRSSDQGKIKLTVDQGQQFVPGPRLGGFVNLSGSQQLKWNDGVKIDEFAIYPKTLSGTQVVEHYNFIRSRRPNSNYNATAVEVDATIGNHIVLPVQNELFEEDPMPALASRIPEPTIIAGKSKTVAADTSDINATLVNPSIITESIHYVSPMLSSANLETVFVANNQYYNYVKTISNLHRYYSFDTATPFTNHGSDTTYAVPDIEVNGQVVQYGLSINNKSVMTAGVTPLGGVTLYESQHDDSWGSVGNGNFFTSFWMERPYFDTSAPGLRMVANINSPSNNHYVLLYQAGGLLWLDSSNGTDMIRSSSTTNPALFGYGTHQVLISFDNTNQNARHIRVYVDKVLFIEQNIGNINLDFVNGGSDQPDNPDNNYPRMSLGSLITPFEITSLPQYPANIRATFDEIIWANTTATSTIINGLYDYMPIRTGSFNEATPITATCELVNPTVSTGTTVTAEAMLAFPAQTEPVLSLQYSINIAIDPFDATADINDAVRSDSVRIVSELFLASATIGFPGAPRIINATALTASIELINRTVTGVQPGQGNGILVNGFKTFDPNSKWVQYVVSTRENTLIPMREVR